jgi:hypothetical protein
MRRNVLVTVLVLVALVQAPIAPPVAAVEGLTPEAVGKITAHGTVEVNGAVGPAEASIFSGDRIATRENTAVAIAFPGGDQVFLPERTQARVESAEGGGVRVRLERGALALVSRSKTPLRVTASGVEVEAGGTGALLEIALKEDGLKVMARRGNALVRGSNKTVDVKEGTTLDASTGPPPQGAGAAGLSPLMTTVLVSSVALGVTGFVLGMVALQRSKPQDCRVTGSTSPFTITCP